jgi:hypothetical protein
MACCLKAKMAAVMAKMKASASAQQAAAADQRRKALIIWRIGGGMSASA